MIWVTITLVWLCPQAGPQHLAASIAMHRQPVACYGCVSGEVNDGPSVCTRRFQSFPAVSGAAEFKAAKSMFLCLQLMEGDLSPTAGHLTASRCPDTMQLVPTSVAAAPPLQSSPPPPRTCVRKNQLKRSRNFREWCRGCGYVSPPWPLCLPRWSPELSALHMWMGCHM